MYLIFVLFQFGARIMLTCSPCLVSPLPQSSWHKSSWLCFSSPRSGNPEISLSSYQAVRACILADCILADCILADCSNLSLPLSLPNLCPFVSSLLPLLALSLLFCIFVFACSWCVVSQGCVPWFRCFVHFDFEMCIPVYISTMTWFDPCSIPGAFL